MDLKPANLVYLHAWRLIDMESVALARPHEVLEECGVPRRVGGRDYGVTWVITAPELARSILEDNPIEPSEKLDVWAWGITLVFIVTGRYLFDVTRHTADLLANLTSQQVYSALLEVLDLRPWRFARSMLSQRSCSTSIYLC